MSYGRPVLLVHAGACDASMWDGFPLVGATRHEMRGFGQTPPPVTGSYSHTEDLEAALGGSPAVLVGASFGGLVCLHIAARRPELVTALVLLDAPLPDHEWSGEVEAFGAAEERLYEAGDLAAAAELNAEFWAGHAAPEVKARVRAMQLRAFELQSDTEAEEDELGPVDLPAVRAPALVVVGELDKPDFLAIGRRLAAELPDARHAVVPGAGHLPALERPAETAALIADFLA